MNFEKNSIVTVKIEDIGMEGEGIGKVDGYTLFVKDAVVGDLVEAKVLKAKKNYAYARLERVLEKSPHRVEPRCAFHRQCGGCQIQAVSYERQLQFKQDKVKNNLLRIGGFAPEIVKQVMEPIVGMDSPFHYRNKAQYPIGKDKEGKPIAGFYAGRTHSIIANTECFLGHKDNQQILEIILKYMEQYQVSSYDEETGEGLLRHVLIRTGFTSGEIMVCLVINGGGKGQFLPAQDKLIAELIKVSGMTSISVSINTERTNVIMGKEIHTLWGEATIQDVIHVRDMEKEGYPFTGEELTFKISPLSFYQVNPEQTEKLYSLALSYAGLTGQETVWDLYCGIGTISLFLAQRAKQVCGVEIVPQAIEDARENAVRNGLSNAQFYVGKAEEVLPEKYEKEGIYADVIVVDPPRKGCDDACLQTMLKMQPKRIVYVSCDSATMARDLKILCEGGYELKKVRPVDQFANTVHTEAIGLLVKSVSEKKTKINYREEEIPDCGCIYG